MVRLILATRNAHKVQEFAEILGPDFEVSDLSSLPEMPPVEETGETFEENAILKALAVSRVCAGDVVSDDSGLEVDALGNAPGVRSARYAGEQASDSENVARLLRELEAAGMNGRPRAARFRCVVALARDGEIVRTFHGSVAGTISESADGLKGFGYDPVFIPEGYEKTLATLGPEVKHTLSHRAMALGQLRAFFAEPPHR